MNVDTKIEEFASLRDGTTLVIQRWLPGPVERIWNYLTDSDLRRKWLAAGDMTLTPGGGFELIWRNDELSDASDPRPAGFAEEQRMESRMIAVEPPRLLTYAWGKGDVTFELEPRGDKVLLTLTHRGLDDPSMRDMTASGWHMHLEILGARVAGRDAASFWSGWTRLHQTYRARLASTR